MPDGSATLTLTLHQKIADVPAAEWDACAGDGNPFVSHAFLSALEDSGSANAAHRLAAAARGAARRGRPGRGGGADVRQVAQLRRIRVRPRLGARAGTRRRRLLSEAAGRGAVQSRRPGRACCAIRMPACRWRRWLGVGAGVPVARPVVGARHVLHRSRMAGAGRGRLAAARSACSSIGRTPATPASTISSARCRRASARCCGASGAMPTPPA